MTERTRTTKSRPITSEMTWQDRLKEYRKLNENYDEAMSWSSNERAWIMFALFAENRHRIIMSLPKDLSAREYKEQIYFRTYGEHLPVIFSRTTRNDV